MITTVSLNTSLDHTYFMEKVNIGEVNRIHKCIQTPGGKGLNVARVIKLCETDVQCIGTIGGFTGQKIIHMLDELNINHQFVQTIGESRKCINIIDRNNQSTELLEPGDEITEQEIMSFKIKYEQAITSSDIVTISGSIPENVDTSLYKELIQEAHRQHKKVILDTSGRLLEEGIEALPTIIKPNQDELSYLIGEKITTIRDAVQAADKLQKKGIEIVIVSLGGEGAIFATEEAIYQAKPPKIKPVNTVGSGDAMVAALAVCMTKQISIEKMMRYAVAISAANTLSTITGDFKQEDMNLIYEQIKIENITEKYRG